MTECPKFNIPCPFEPNCFIFNAQRCLITITNLDVSKEEKKELIEKVNTLTDPSIRYQKDINTNIQGVK